MCLHFTTSVLRFDYDPFMQAAIEETKYYDKSAPKKKRRRKNSVSESSSVSTLLCEVFDGTETHQIHKPASQSKVYSRNMDPVGQELLDIISKEGPLYLATQDAFPDHSTMLKANYCLTMVTRAALLLKELGANEAKVAKIEHTIAAFKADTKYRKALSKIVSVQVVVRLNMRMI